MSAWADPNAQRLDLGQNSTNSGSSVEAVVPVQHEKQYTKKGEGKGNWNQQDGRGEGKPYKPKDKDDFKPAATSKIHKDADGFITRR